MKKQKRKIFKQIMALRKEGRLQEAFDAYQNFQSNDKIEKEWAEKALSWIYYDLLKPLIEQQDYIALRKLLKEIKQKGLLADGDDLFTDAVWKKIGFVFMDLCKSSLKSGDYSAVDDFYYFVKENMSPTESDGFSIFLSAALKVDDEWDNFPDFIKWWDLANLQEADFHMRKDQRGNPSIISLGEQALLSYSRWLLERNKDKTASDSGYESDLIEMKRHAKVIENVIDSGITQKWLNYALAKLLLRLDEDQHGLEEFIPFALKNTDKFWVWSTLAQFYSELGKEEKSFNAYCKAFDLEAPDKFLVNVRENFIHLLLTREEFDWAKSELNDLVATRESENWSIDMELDMLLCSDWYDSANILDDHIVDQKYDKPAEKAEKELFDYANQYQGHIEWVDKKSNKVGIRLDEDTFGVYKSQRRLKNYREGQFVEVKGLKEKSQVYILSIRKIGVPSNQDWVIDFKGELSRPRNNTDAFVFDEEKIISILLLKRDLTSKLKNGDIVEGKALKKWNTSKNKWEYQAIKVN